MEHQIPMKTFVAEGILSKQCPQKTNPGRYSVKVTTEVWGYSYSSWSDNRLQWQFFAPKKGPPYTQRLHGEPHRWNFCHRWNRQISPVSPVTTGEVVSIWSDWSQTPSLSWISLQIWSLWVIDENMTELQFIKYLSPKISPPRVISDADKPQNSVSRLISPVKMPHRWQFFNRWPHQWRFCHRWCHHNRHHRWHRHRCNLCLYWKYSDTVTVGLSDSFANPRGCHGNRRLLYLTTIEWDWVR